MLLDILHAQAMHQLGQKVHPFFEILLWPWRDELSVSNAVPKEFPYFSMSLVDCPLTDESPQNFPCAYAFRHLTSFGFNDLEQA